VLNGVSKDLPFRLGRGETEEATRLANAGAGAMLLTSVGSWLLLCAFLFGPARGRHEPLVVGGLLVAGAVVVVEELLLLHVSVLRAHGRIAVISRAEILYALVNLALSVALLLRFELAGMLAAWIVTRAGALLYYRFASRLVFRPTIDRARVAHLLRRGGWIFVYLLLAALLRTLDRTVILGGLGVESLGFYALAATVAGLLANVPAALAFVIYPEFLKRYGETGDPRALDASFRRWTLALAHLVPPAVLLIVFLIPIPLHYLLPGYLGAVPAMRLLLCGALLGSLAPVAVFFLLAIDRDRLLVAASAAGTALGFALCMFAVARGKGIAGVAAAKAIADTIYAAVVVHMAARYARDRFSAGWELLGRCARPILVTLGAAAVALLVVGPPSWQPAGAELGRSLALAGVGAILVTPFVVRYAHREGLVAFARSRLRGGGGGAGDATDDPPDSGRGV
jgi:O-antigen/teichoic acid export membrane protein